MKMMICMRGIILKAADTTQSDLIGMSNDSLKLVLNSTLLIYN